MCQLLKNVLLQSSSDSEDDYVSDFPPMHIVSDETARNSTAPDPPDHLARHESTPVHDPTIWSEWPRRNRRPTKRLGISSWNDKSYDE